jgi:hypothetical protein
MWNERLLSFCIKEVRLQTWYLHVYQVVNQLALLSSSYGNCNLGCYEESYGRVDNSDHLGSFFLTVQSSWW